MGFRILLFCISIWAICPVAAQSQPGDIALILAGAGQGTPAPQKSSRQWGKPHTWPLKAPLFFYQSVLSGQISAGCPFRPTCSSFCRHAIDQLGIAKGLFLTADRLSRCTGSALFDAPPYLIDPAGNHVSDPPSMYCTQPAK